MVWLESTEGVSGRAGEPAARCPQPRVCSPLPGVGRQQPRARQGRSGARGIQGVGNGERACVADLDAARTLLRSVRWMRTIQQLASRARVTGSYGGGWREATESVAMVVTVSLSQQSPEWRRNGS